MKILITGITGSGGSFLADYIVENHPSVEVHGISRWHSTTTAKNLKKSGENVFVHECDMNDFSALLSVIKLVKPDMLFHLASYANVRASFINPLSVMNNNVMITANLLEAVKQVEIDPIIQICSTSEVYGLVDEKNVPITEECPVNPASPYAVSKLAQDYLGHVYYKAYGMKIIRTRMFTYINPRRADLFATSFATQIVKIERGEEDILRHGNLNSVRTIIDVRDAMESYWVAALKCKPGEVYNIGGKTTITVGAFLDLLKEKARVKIKSEVDPALLRPVDVTLQIPDTTKFKKETGWEPKYSFEESVKYLLDYLRGNR